MKIIATVNFGKTQVAQHWEYQEKPFRHLVLLRAEHEGQPEHYKPLNLDTETLNRLTTMGQDTKYTLADRLLFGETVKVELEYQEKQTCESEGM